MLDNLSSKSQGLFLKAIIKQTRKHQEARSLKTFKVTLRLENLEHTDKHTVQPEKMQSNTRKDFWGSISVRLKDILQEGVYYSQYLYQYSLSQEASTQKDSSQAGPIFPLFGPNIPHRNAVLCMHLKNIYFLSVKSSEISIVFLQQLKDLRS